jgi:DNA-binding transcriptional MerR regulator/methylmalonyl-CoA mutase cobalamin-binding subunit
MVAKASQDPTYNLKVVLHSTGIKPDTLRAWERRYGLPRPRRTPGGHRLYSQYDIDMIKWLMQRLEDGMRINRAVELWRGLEAQGKDPLAEVRRPAQVEPPASGMLVAGTMLEAARRQWVAACLAFEESTAERLLAQSFARYPLESVCLEVLQKGLAELGTLWYQGQATVQQEHFASNLALRRLEALIAASPAPARPERILVCCPPEEEHVFAPLLITLFLRQRGWDVVYLGANVPQMHLEKAALDTRAKLVVLAACQLYTAANLAGVASFLYDQRLPLAYGGPIFNRQPELRQRVAGHFLGERLEQAVAAIEKLLAFPPRLPAVAPASLACRAALKDLLDQRSFVEACVWDGLRRSGVDTPLQVANQYLMRNILAALALGDMNFAGRDGLGQTLIASYGLPAPAASVSEYLCGGRRRAIA